MRAWRQLKRRTDPVQAARRTTWNNFSVACTTCWQQHLITLVFPSPSAFSTHQSALHAMSAPPSPSLSSTKLTRLVDILPQVLNLISAYDLAFLYFSGDSSLRSTIVKRAQVFNLRYDPYRRISWPGNFIRLLSDLQHFHIGGHEDHLEPFVANADIRALPSSLLTLELRIANGLLSMLEPCSSSAASSSSALSAIPSLSSTPPQLPTDQTPVFINIEAPTSYESSQNVFSLCNLPKLFPNLRELHWRHTMFDAETYFNITQWNSCLNFSSLRSLTISPTQIISDLTFLPTSVLELRLYLGFTTVWERSAIEDLKFPSQLLRLEFLELGTGLRRLFWPSGLEHLRIEFRAYSRVLIQPLNQVIRECGPYPSSLKSLFIFAPLSSLSTNDLATLPSNLEELHLYLDKAHIPSIPTDWLGPKLRILELAICNPSYQGSLNNSEFLSSIPSSCCYLSLNLDKDPLNIFQAAPEPQNLISFRSSPSYDPVVCPGMKYFPIQILPPLSSSSPQSALFSLMDLEACFQNFASFPPTLTRLTLHQSTDAPHFDALDTKDLASYIPNVTDLTLCSDDAFQILENCTSLPLISLQLSHSKGASQVAKPHDITLNQLDCFPRLERLAVSMRLIPRQSLEPWLTGLPSTLTDLFLAPISDLFLPCADEEVVESWIVFPLLPRSLKIFGGFISDLNVYNIFALLPPLLTELYLPGLALMQSTNPPKFRSDDEPTFLNPDYLESLPLHLHTLVLPSSCFSPRPNRTMRPSIDFFASRPQLSLFCPNIHHSLSTVKSTIAIPVLASPRYIFSFDNPYSNLELAIKMQYSLGSERDHPEASRSFDSATREAATRRTKHEIKAHRQASEIVTKDSYRAAHTFLKAKLAEIAAKDAKSGKSSNEKLKKCIIS